MALNVRDYSEYFLPKVVVASCLDDKQLGLQLQLDTTKKR
jgi:hypothetical protein